DEKPSQSAADVAEKIGQMDSGARSKLLGHLKKMEAAEKKGETPAPPDNYYSDKDFADLTAADRQLDASNTVALKLILDLTDDKYAADERAAELVALQSMDRAF